MMASLQNIPSLMHLHYITRDYSIWISVDEFYKTLSEHPGSHDVRKNNMLSTFKLVENSLCTDDSGKLMVIFQALLVYCFKHCTKYMFCAKVAMEIEMFLLQTQENMQNINSTQEKRQEKQDQDAAPLRGSVKYISFSTSQDTFEKWQAMKEKNNQDNSQLAKYLLRCHENSSQGDDCSSCGSPLVLYCPECFDIVAKAEEPPSPVQNHPTSQPPMTSVFVKELCQAVCNELYGSGEPSLAASDSRELHDTEECSVAATDPSELHETEGQSASAYNTSELQEHEKHRVGGHTQVPGTVSKNRRKLYKPERLNTSVCKGKGPVHADDSSKLHQMYALNITGGGKVVQRISDEQDLTKGNELTEYEAVSEEPIANNPHRAISGTFEAENEKQHGIDCTSCKNDELCVKSETVADDREGVTLTAKNTEKDSCSMNHSDKGVLPATFCPVSPTNTTTEGSNLSPSAPVWPSPISTVARSMFPRPPSAGNQPVFPAPVSMANTFASPAPVLQGFPCAQFQPDSPLLLASAASYGLQAGVQPPRGEQASACPSAFSRQLPMSDAKGESSTNKDLPLSAVGRQESLFSVTKEGPMFQSGERMSTSTRSEQAPVSDSKTQRHTISASEQLSLSAESGLTTVATRQDLLAGCVPDVTVEETKLKSHVKEIKSCVRGKLHLGKQATKNSGEPCRSARSRERGGECTDDQSALDLPLGFSDHPENAKHVEHSEEEGPLPFQCPKCASFFKTFRLMLSHLRTHPHPNMQCPLCKQKLYVPFSLSKHVCLSMHLRDFICTVCGVTIGALRRYEEHFRIHSGVKPYLCHICGKSFTHHGVFSPHVKAHSKPKPNYSCAQCNKSFTHPSGFYRHKLVHSGEKRCVCEVCGKCFNLPMNLKLHMRRHTGEKPYQCKECGACYKDRSCLTIHQRTHSGEKPFKCEICGRCFAVRSNLRSHYRTHKDYSGKCDICGKVFASKSSFHSHYLTHKNQKQ